MILTHSEHKQAARRIFDLERTQQSRQLLLIAQAVDSVQGRLQRAHALLVGERGIHARGVEIAVFLFQRRSCWARLSGCLQLLI